MIGRLLASAAFVAGMLTATAPTSMAWAQMAAPPAANPPAASSGATGSPKALSAQPAQPTMSHRASQGSASTNPSGLSSSRQTAQGHEQSNGVADKLNACEAKPMTERQACFDAATRM